MIPGAVAASTSRPVSAPVSAGAARSTASSLCVPTVQKTIACASNRSPLSVGPNDTVAGSCAKGSNTEASDIDVWILVEGASERGLAELTRKLKAMDERIKPLYLTQDRIGALKKEDLTFYYSIYFGSIDIFGDKNEPI